MWERVVQRIGAQTQDVVCLARQPEGHVVLCRALLVRSFPSMGGKDLLCLNVFSWLTMKFP